MLSYFTQCTLLAGQILSINTRPAKRYVRQDIMIFHWRQWKRQTHLALLQEISLLSLASFYHRRAVISMMIAIDTFTLSFLCPSRECEHIRKKPNRAWSWPTDVNATHPEPSITFTFRFKSKWKMLNCTLQVPLWLTATEVTFYTHTSFLNPKKYDCDENYFTISFSFPTLTATGFDILWYNWSTMTYTW